MFLELNLKPTVFVLIVIMGVFIAALLVVAVLKFIQIVRKQVKRNKKAKNRSVDEVLVTFGGKENVTEISVKLNTVSIKVIDKEKVKFDDLKAMKIGCQIIGNTIKCSSEYLADALKGVQNGSK